MSKNLEVRKLNIKKEKTLSSGTGESDVDLVTLKIGRKNLTLARKKPLEDEYDMARQLAEYQFGIHELLKKKGYPVPVTWRYDEKTGETLVTDLTEKGKNWIIDIQGPDFEEQVELKEVNIINLDDIKRDTLDIAIRAANDGIHLSNDCYFFVVNKETGLGKVILGDLGSIGVSKINLGEPEKEKLRESNLKTTEFVLEIIQQLLS